MKNFIKNAFNSIKNIDKEKIKKVFSIVSLLIIIILIIALTKSCEKQQKLKHQVETVIALNDSLKLIKKTDTSSIYQKPVITISPKEIIKEGFPIKDQETKKLIEELAKEKSLSAAVSIKLQKADSIIKSIKSKNQTEDCYGTYNFIDSTSNLEYNVLMSVDSLVTLNMSYKYKLSFTALVTEDKKGYKATYKFDDPDINLQSADFLYIPKKPLSKKHKALNILVPTLSGLAGGAIGYTIGHYVVPTRK